MYYRHNLNYEYPDRCDEHMITPKKQANPKIDTEYRYRDTRFRFRVIRVIYWILVTVIVFPLMKLTHGLRVCDKRKLKKYKKELKGGAITVANHVFYWDFLCVLRAIHPHLSYFPVWKTNLEGENRHLIRMSGGIPVPTDNFRAMMKFNEAIESVLREGKWLHFYPEGSMWLFYPDIRPLKIAVFQYAVKFDKPVIPITMSFRPRRGIPGLFSKKPAVDLHVGEPMYHDKTISRREAAEELRARVYHKMQEMNGIHEGDPTYNVDQNPDNYVKTM